MKQLPPEAVAQLEGREPIIGGAARLRLADDDRRCFFSGVGTIDIEGDTFKGVANRALITPISSRIGGASDSVVVTLSHLDPDVAASVESVNYYQKPMTIWRIIFAPDTFTVLGTPAFLRGRLDHVVVREVVGGLAALDFHIEGPRKDMDRAGGRIRSNADQRVLGGDLDAGLKWVSTVARKTLRWGQKQSTAGTSIGGVNLQPYIGVRSKLLGL